MTSIKLKCPVCGVKLPDYFDRKLNGFWKLIRTEPCPGCSASLRWGSQLHKKILFWGGVTRGLYIFFVLTVVPLAVFSKKLPLLAFVPFVIFLFIVVSILATKTKPDEIYLEEVKND